MDMNSIMTIVVSVLSSSVVAAFWAGTAWGRLKSIDNRLKNIEGLFQLQLRVPSNVNVNVGKEGITS